VVIRKRLKDFRPGSKAKTLVPALIPFVTTLVHQFCLLPSSFCIDRRPVKTESAAKIKKMKPVSSPRNTR
jgi:hypothetical protein